MEKSSDKYIDHKAYIRYLRKVTGEQLNMERIRREVQERIFGKGRFDCE